ncbi:endoplasmic oxidoreductin-1 [[Candida] railenensis]|uniref:Endoplasmic oxidoreductin-1 n=1 Tax=[Candida] railenensis TaxID=45579 RepID=A0A9P0VWU9_9ASCO|nr:endoplasmic oxidoreductin-1 [[Candida] railenensis]
MLHWDIGLLVTLTATISSVIATRGGGSSPISNFSPFDSQDFCSQIITPTCNTTFSYIDNLNAQIRPDVSNLVRSPYFRYFKLDFDKQCKFWNAQHFCATRNCAVEILPADQYNWSNIEEFSPSKLGEIERPADKDNDAAGTCEDLDYCHIDEGQNCVYVDLLANPERFTGYGGVQAFDVWKAIYSENCFPNTNPMSMDDSDQLEQCVEKNLFYRLISGMHASIAVHLSNEYLCPSDVENDDDYNVEEIFEPNLKIFMERVGSFNDRLSNIYFNYALVSQAIVKLSEIFEGGLADQITCGDESLGAANKAAASFGSNNALLGNDEPDYKQVFGSILPLLNQHTLFNTTELFDPKVVSPELKMEFRQRFRNVSAIMDCVGCDRCRMWGKLQTIGYGTALKILFEDESHKLKFRRIEMVSLFNTFDRISKSIEAINNFKQMYLKHLEDVAQGKAQLGDYEKGRESKKGFSFPFLAVESKAKDTSSAPQSQSVPKQSVESDTKTKKTRSKKLLMPEKKNKRTFKDEFKASLDEVSHATYFVLNSYRTFFPTIRDIALIYLNDAWNKFLGNNAYYDQLIQKGYQREMARAEQQKDEAAKGSTWKDAPSLEREEDNENEDEDDSIYNKLFE